MLVHGGGKRITEWLERLGVPSRFEGGLRVTDQAALDVAAAVLRGVVNSELVSDLRDRGVDAVGLSGVDGGLMIAERVPGLGLVAHVVGIRRDFLDALLVAGPGGRGGAARPRRAGHRLQRQRRRRRGRASPPASAPASWC